MSTYKSFLASDIIISPFEVNKLFLLQGEVELNDIGIERYLGKNIINGPFISESAETTGQNYLEYKDLIFNSIKQLYYGNYITSNSSNGNALKASGPYQNSLGSDLYFKRSFPDEEGKEIVAFSIPSKLYGNRIQPTTFLLEAESGSLFDDGEGNLIRSSTNGICGNIMYNQGIAVITTNGPLTASNYGDLNGGYGGNQTIYSGDTVVDFVKNFIESPNITCSFSSSYDIIETQYKCTVRSNEFNYSLNPSLLNSSPSNYDDYITSSDFSPFVTAVGLYNDDRELVAVGKLSQPLNTSQTTDTTIFINIDR